MSGWTRRTFLVALGATGTTAALEGQDTNAKIHGGRMALSQSYQVADKLWIGPDSAKSNVDAKSGRLYIATDTGTSYNGDSGSWDTVGLGGSGTSLTVEDDGSQVVSGADVLDFGGSHFDATNPTGSEVLATLTNDSVTVAGNTVALGGSTGIAPADLSADVTGSEIDLSTIAGQNITVDATNDELDAATGGTDVEIQDDGTTVVNVTDLIDFQGGYFAVSNPSGSEASVSLSNDSITVNGGDGIKNGGSAALGGSLTLDVEPADIAGDGTEDDGSDNLRTHNVRSISSNVTAGDLDIVLADASGSALTVTLPAVSTNIEVNIKKTDSSSNAVTVATPNSETIDGSSSIDITGQYTSRTIVSDGNNYFVV